MHLSGSYVLGTVKCRSSAISGARCDPGSSGRGASTEQQRRRPTLSQIIRRFSDAMQLILSRLGPSSLPDEALPFGYTGQRGVHCLFFVFTPTSSSGGLNFPVCGKNCPSIRSLYSSYCKAIRIRSRNALLSMSLSKSVIRHRRGFPHKCKVYTSKGRRYRERTRKIRVW
ncbi:hypothetical protein M413DRAFT_317330 [Hebeloma cylindrosporum]|uniref:Uncharacterized protein n=1 Tax=Hebeloma cylindrosporum TaxID=76867 RepID=A0A0C3CCM5_HEBCY|nr:hypothetical protein M413DRAFT_317330 [Hebeloma cylindrosporum h7]